MKNCSQWIVTNGKIPEGNAHDPKNWKTYEAAAAAGKNVGFVFTENDPYFFIDIDHCIGDNGRLSPLAAKLCSFFAGAYVEKSQSGLGIHIVGRCPGASFPAHRCKNSALGLELYTEKRFMLYTGNGEGDANLDCADKLQQFVTEYMQPPVTSTRLADDVRAEWDGYTDDDELIRAALAQRSAAAAFGGVTFADLWNNNVQVLSKHYPRGGGDDYDASAADAALASHLAYWTGCDEARIERLMLRSQLVRDKWEIRGYLARTIEAVCNGKEQVHKRRKAPANTPTPAQAFDGSTAPFDGSGTRIIDPTEQMKLWAGFVYVVSENKIWDEGRGALLNKEQFDNIYGCAAYVLSADKLTDSAWKAFIQSQYYQKAVAERVCYRPDIEERIVEGALNVYINDEGEQTQGDVSPYLDLLALNIPNERDRRIYIAWCAACVQHPGKKFRWALVMQGAEGTGKSLLARCIRNAVGGRNVGAPRSDTLGRNFNAWLFGKRLYVVEDMYSEGHDKRTLMESLKPLITDGEGREIEKKGVDSFEIDICGNFYFNSNNKDALPKGKNDRRYCVFYSAIQDGVEAARHADTFREFAAWYENGGDKIVNWYLHTVEIDPEFDPVGACQRAPETTSTREAISENISPVAALIRDAIDTERPGFKGGFISSIAIKNLILENRMKWNIRSINNALDELGYVKHPALTNDGKCVRRCVLPDGGRPRLYVKPGSRACSLTENIDDAYTNEQEGLDS